MAFRVVCSLAVFISQCIMCLLGTQCAPRGGSKGNCQLDSSFLECLNDCRIDHVFHITGSSSLWSHCSFCLSLESLRHFYSSSITYRFSINCSFFVLVCDVLATFLKMCSFLSHSLMCFLVKKKNIHYL